MYYIAFLRGVNVGGKMVSMEKLKLTLKKSGFGSVKTLLNSGNVVFDSEEKNNEAVKKKLEGLLKETFGFETDVFVRSSEQLKSMISKKPFRNVKVTEDTCLYVTFAEKAKPTIKTPCSETGFKILKVEDDSIYGVVDLSKIGTVDYMSFLSKQFGKNITTRNWNTLEKAEKLIL